MNMKYHIHYSSWGDSLTLSHAKTFKKQETQPSMIFSVLSKSCAHYGLYDRAAAGIASVVFQESQITKINCEENERMPEVLWKIGEF